MGEYKLILGWNDSIEIQNLDGTPVSNFTLRDISQRLAKKCRSLSAHVYVFHDSYHKLYKIGFTTQPVKKRFSQITAQEGRIEFMCAFSCRSELEARHLETIMHDLYKEYHVRGEWYNLLEEEVSRLKEYSKGIEVIGYLLPLWQKIRYFDLFDRRFSILSYWDYELRRWSRDLEDQKRQIMLSPFCTKVIEQK